MNGVPSFPLWERFLVEYGVTRTRYPNYSNCQYYAQEGCRHASEQWAAWRFFLACAKMKGEV